MAKSPISPPLAFPFDITSSGILLLNDEGKEMKGPQINTIHCQGLFSELLYGEICRTIILQPEEPSNGIVSL